MGKTMKVKRYPVAVFPIDGVFSAEVPDLPGVITAVDHLEELRDSVLDAASLWIEAETNIGRSIPSPSSIEKWDLTHFYRDRLWIFIDIPVP